MGCLQRVATLAMMARNIKHQLIPWEQDCKIQVSPEFCNIVICSFMLCKGCSCKKKALRGFLMDVKSLGHAVLTPPSKSSPCIIYTYSYLNYSSVP